MRSLEKLKSRFSAFILALIIFILTTSCEVGLGPAVDTLVPAITIETPVIDAVIRDSFTISGAWSDDGAILSVTVTLTDTENGKKYGSFPATVDIKGVGQGTWKVNIDKSNIPDGPYEINTAITDLVGHQNAIQRQITVDNTAPVLVMQRPLSKLGTTGSVENYGRIFTIDGQAADDSGVGLIEVEVYSDAQLQNHLKTLSFTNVPNTISLDVAKFIEGEQNDYSAIYGSTNYLAGQKTLYCKIIAYDGAKRYPLDGEEQTAEDLKGNATTNYYLYNDIADEVLSQNKITELYKMKNGRFAGTQTARTAATDNLARYEIGANVFTLNPMNNPVFTIAGFTEMAANGNFEAANMCATNGDFLTIQVEPGLDGYLLVKDSLRVKVKRADLPNSSWIYPSSQNISKDGDKYKIIAYMQKEDGLIATKNYVVVVEGYDEEQNAVTTPAGIGYGFNFKKNSVAPTLTITQPAGEDTVVYNKTADYITISGKVNFPAEICDGGDVIIKHTPTNREWKVGHFSTDTNENWTINLLLKKENTDERYDSVDAKGVQLTGNDRYYYIEDNELGFAIYTKYEEFDDPGQDKFTDTINRSFKIDTKEPATPTLQTVGSYIDDTDPEHPVTVHPLFNTNNWYTNQNIDIGVNAADVPQVINGYKSNVQTTQYKIGANGEWTNLNSTTMGYLNGLSDGTNYLYFRCIDGVGNVSDATTTPEVLKVDTLRPTVIKAWIGSGSDWTELDRGRVININQAHGKKLKLEIEENNSLVSPTVNITGSSDPIAGAFAANPPAEGDNWIWESTNPVTPANNTAITVSILAKDQAMNSNNIAPVTATYKFLVDTAAPVIVITSPDGNLSGARSWGTNSSETIRASITDTSGNVAVTKYKISSYDQTEAAAIAEAEGADAATHKWYNSALLGTLSVPVSISSGTSLTGSGDIGRDSSTNAHAITEGKWFLYVYSKDDAGNAGVEKRYFWTDVDAPAFSNVTPAEGSYTYNKANYDGSASTTPAHSFTIAGKATDHNGIASVEYSIDGATWTPLTVSDTDGSWSKAFTYGAAGSDLPDKSTAYKIDIRATDTAGRTATKPYTILVDTTPPSEGTGTNAPQVINIPDSGWFRSTTVVPEVTPNDGTAGSGIQKVEYKINGQGDWAPLISNNGTYTGGITFAGSGKNHFIALKVTDNAGNSIGDDGSIKIENIKIDTEAPELSVLKYQVDGKDASTDFTDFAYINATTGLKVWGKYKDTVSGVQGLQIKYQGINTPLTGTSGADIMKYWAPATAPDSVTADNIPAADSAEWKTLSDITDKTKIVSWMATIPNNQLHQSGTLHVSGKDVAENACNSSVISVKFDNTAPSIANISLSTNSTKTKTYKAGSNVYWINNDTTHDSTKKFTLKGNSTDENIKSTTLKISSSNTFPDTTATHTSYTTNNQISWSFEVPDFNGFGSGVTEVYARITSDDYAGNSSYSDITIKFDNTPAKFKHRLDAKGKDVDFRIGTYANDAGTIEDVGGKYKTGTWGQTHSLEVRGTVDETGGSGLSKIYYKVVDIGTATTEAAIEAAINTAITAFESNPASAKTGVIEASDLSTAALVTAATRSVDYTTVIGSAQSAIPVTSSYKGTISVPVEGSNYVLFASEDNVGNITMDNMGVVDNPDDPNAPPVSIVEKVSSAVYGELSTLKTTWNNGKKYYKLNVDTVPPVVPHDPIYTKDSNGGSPITLSGPCSDVGSGIKSVTLKVKYADNNIKQEPATVTNDVWSATIPLTDLADVQEGGTYNISVEAKDDAGNITTETVAILRGDMTAPAADLIGITPSVDKTTSTHYIRPTLDDITVNGSTTDTAEEIQTWLKLVPCTLNAGVLTESPTATPVYKNATSPEQGNMWSIVIPKNSLDAENYAGAKLYACTKDAAGNESEATATARARNLLSTLVFDEAAPVYNSTDTQVGGLQDPDTWHKSTTLSVKGSWSDAAGVNKVYYKLTQSTTAPAFNAEEWSEFTVVENSSTGKFEFENTISGFAAGYNYVYMVAVDKLGNVAKDANGVVTSTPLTIKVDTQAPSASEYTDNTDSAHPVTYSFNDIYLTNGESPKTFYFNAQDNTGGSGIKQTRADTKITLGQTVLNDTQATVTFSDTEPNVTVVIDDSVLSGTGYRSVVVTLKDYAGNYADVTIGTLNLDDEDPTVEFAALKDADSAVAGTQVNKILTITGTAKDTYLETQPLTKLQYKKQSDSTWTDIDLTDSSNIGDNKLVRQLTNAADFTIKLDTEKLEDNETYNLRVEVKDQAGNTGNKKPDGNVAELTFKVDQDTDRPVIKFTNLDLSGNSHSLFVKTLKGTVSDDDDVTELWVSTNGGTSYGDAPVPVSGGSWTYQFAADNTYTLAFKVKDDENREFLTGQFTTPAALQNSPKITDGTTSIGLKTPVPSAASPVSTQFDVMVDTALPVTRSMQYKLTEGTADFGPDLPKLGGPANVTAKNKLDIKLEAGDENGITNVMVTLGTTNITSNGTQTVTISDTSNIHVNSRIKFGTDAVIYEDDYKVISFVANTSITVDKTVPTGYSKALVILDGTKITPNGSETTENGKVYTEWKIENINVSPLADGAHSLLITTTDGAGSDKPETVTLIIDRTSPVIGITAPTDTTTSTGNIWAYGTIEGAETLQYAISPSSTITPDGTTAVTQWEKFDGATHTTSLETCSDPKTLTPNFSEEMEFGINWNIYFDNNLSATTDEHSFALKDYLVKYGITTTAKLLSRDENVQFNDLVKLYLWMKAVDDVGNVKIEKFPIILDPQGDRPTVDFTYPGSTQTPLGGEVTIYGTATDTEGDNPGVDSVWVQIISDEHGSDTTTTYGSFGTADSDSDGVDDSITSFEISQNDLIYMASKGYQIYHMNTGAAWTGSLAAGTQAKDYAARATLSGTAWLLAINGQQEFNPQGTGNNQIAIRVYARDNDDKFSMACDKLVYFDANKPVISNLKLVRYGKNADNSYNFSNVLASQMYEANLFLKGDWWLTGEATDTDNIGGVTISESTGEKQLVVTTTPAGSATKVTEIKTVTDASAEWDVVNGSDNHKKIYFKYRLGTDGDNTVGAKNITLIVADCAENMPNEQTQPIAIKWDNKKPDIAQTLAEGKNINEKVQQSNSFFRFSSKASEPKQSGYDQSGYAYTAFYFERTYGTNGATKKLYDVLQARTSATKDISGQDISNLGSEAEDAENNTIVKENKLYWFVKSATSDGTMTVTMSDTSNVHVNSLVSIGNAYYLVKSLAANISITVDRNVPAGYNKAYVALAGIIDNTASEDKKSTATGVQADGYYAASDLDRDDGDRMIETVGKQDTTWTWEARICSRNIPDGPVKLHYVVFDKAGNCVHDEVSGYVCNNQPRIAGFTVRTDYTGRKLELDSNDPAVTDYNSAHLGAASKTGTSGSQNVYNPFEISLSENEVKPLSQSIERGSSVEPLMTIRGLTQIEPEIVGGNRNVRYSYDIDNSANSGGHLQGTNNTPIIVNNNLNANIDYTINSSAPINIQLGDLVALQNAANGIPFKFTFIDETEGLSELTAEQQKEFQAKLTVYFAINAVEVSTPDASIKPFYWKSLTENSIKDSASVESYKELLGHIELEEDWTKVKTAATDTEPAVYYSKYDGTASGSFLDADPKVSGQIVLEGVASDDKLLDKIEVFFNSDTGVQVAHYETGGLVSDYPVSGYATNGIAFDFTETIDSTGHSVNWKLYWNTQNTTYVTNVAEKDFIVRVKATNFGVPKRVTGGTDPRLTSIDGTTKYVANQYENIHFNTIGTTQTNRTTNTEFYRMDIVPYVTAVQTSLSHANEDNPSVFNRSVLGHYPVYVTFEGREAATGANSTHGEQLYETVTVTGFNLKTNATVTFAGTSNNTASLTAVSGQANTFTVQIPTGAESGNATVTVEGVDSLNNSNNDESYGDSETTLADVSEEKSEYDVLTGYYYNRQANGENNNLLTDNLCFDVWDFNRAAARPRNNKAKDVMMKINPNNGMIGFAFCSGDLYFSMANGDANDPTSYTYWAKTRDFYQCTGFGFAPNGRSFALAAGGESSSDYADSFNLFVSKWGVTTASESYNGNNTNRIGSTVVDDYDSLTKDRFKSPCVVSDGTYLYVAYFDLITGELRFQGGKNGNTIPNNKADIGTLKDSYKRNGDNRKNLKTLAQEHGLVQVLADNSGNSLGYSGEYVSIGMANNRVVMTWYDSHNGNLEFAYSNENFEPETGVNSTGWTKLSDPLIQGAGQYCQLAVDAENHIHIACFDMPNGYLKYIYLDDYLGTGKKVCTVDSYQSPGKQLTIDVALDKPVAQGGTGKPIPYIGYMGATPDKPRFARLNDAASFSNSTKMDGVKEDKYTGVWECTVVPTIKVEGTNADNDNESALTTHAMRRINVGVWKDKTTGVRTTSKINGTSKYTDSYAGTNDGKCWGNGSDNAVLGYAVRNGKQEFVETAQMREMH
ncbi:MAG: hypothetical protein K6A15_05975 [Treponema sp.]|nr:hypothetical protein [Treponema sp.]